MTQQTVKAADDLLFFFDAGKGNGSRDSEAFETLAHDAFKHLAGALPADGVAIQNAESRRAERPGLHDGSAFFEERDQTIKVRLSDGEGRALDGGDALTRLGVAEVEQGGNDKARGAVDLFKEVIIHQYAAIFRRDEVGAATSGDLYFETAAANFSGDGADGVVLSDFPFFQLRDPDAVHTFGFQNADVFIADQVTFGEKFFSAGPEDGATQDSSGRFSNFNGLGFHLHLNKPQKTRLI